MKALLIFCILIVPSSTWDQILPSSFRLIFPYASVSDVWKLTFDVNHKPSTLGALWYVTNWIPAHWKSKNATLDPKNKLSNQTYAENQASDFVQHRGAVRSFLRYMFRTTIDTKYFTEEEAKKMREIYWSADLESKNNFTLTRPLFKNQSITEFSTTHKDFGLKFENLTSTYYYMYAYTAVKLNYTLPH